MSITSQSIRKLFRDILTTTTPWYVRYNEIDETKKMLEKRLSTMKDVEINRSRTRYYSSLHTEEKTICRFSIHDHAAVYSFDPNYDFRLLLDENNHLTIKYTYGSSAQVGNLDELEAFIKTFQQRISRQVTQKSKRGKVREFKAQAIEAQVKKLAKEDKFDFYTVTDTVKLKLYIRLSEKDSLEIHIPFNRFEEILPKLREIIAPIRTAHDQGVKFKINLKSSWHSWITHDSL